MQPSEAEEHLKSMLTAEGFDISNPNPQIAWDVFKSFVQKPVMCAEAGVLFQCGVFNFAGEELFYLDFVRQFSIDDQDGEYDHMEHLHCEFTTTPNEELRQLKRNLWAFDFHNIADYFTAVEDSSEFQTAMSYQDWNCKVEQGVV
jgi:hypothetical protein